MPRLRDGEEVICNRGEDVMSKQMVDSADYEHLAGWARAKGLPMLEAYYMRRAHEAAVVEHRTPVTAPTVTALSVIDEARGKVGSAYEQARAADDAEAERAVGRVVVIETPALVERFVAGLAK
jgi:hypothetical protein